MEKKINYIQVFCRIRSDEDSSSLFTSSPYVSSSGEVFSKIELNKEREDKDLSFSQSGLPNSSLSSLSNINYTSTNRKTSFILNKLFNNYSQRNIFLETVYPYIESFLSGTPYTLFTYGQTGSGKTYTVIGPQKKTEELEENTEGNGEDDGVLPRTIHHLFKALNEKQRNSEDNHIKQELKISFIEIYHEKLNDLIDDIEDESRMAKKSSKNEKNKKNLIIREKKNGEIYVENLNERVINSYSDFQTYFSSAIKKKKMGTHLLNKESSRSHFCCFITLTTLTTSNISQETTKSSCKLSIIDLAGSEMVNIYFFISF